MKILIIDNYDSFTFNLYQYIGEILMTKMEKFVIDVVRNDQLTLQNIKDRKYDRIVISPGPGDPSDSEYFGVCADVIMRLGKRIPVLGVCLGMQGIAYYFGGRVVRAKTPMHGKTSSVRHNGKNLFRNIPQNITVMRYHSLIVQKKTLPASLEIIAVTSDTGEIMGIKHVTYPVSGIQFHPESFATEAGQKLLSNFLLN
jgi:anthranilate synthase/aminodeoxychorismate synthase-like glutamine amidotransferase